MVWCHVQGAQLSIFAVLREPLVEASGAIAVRSRRLLVQCILAADVVGVVGDGRRAFRVMVVSTELDESDVFTGAYCYYVVMLSISAWIPAQDARRHRQGANAEYIIRGLLHGFGLGRLPCGELLGNAALFEVNLLGCNLV